MLTSLFKWKDIYLRPYDHDFFSEIYSNSQYVLGEKAKRGIGDDGLYPFAGFYYISGGDPSQVNFEHPPLGKYLIGLSIIFFKNENFIYLIYAFLTLLVTFSLAQKLFKNKLFAFLSVFILGMSQFFKIQFIPTNTRQLSIALLDLPLTLSFMAGIYFYLTARGRFVFFIISSVFLGIAFSTKFFPSLVLLLPVLGWFLCKDKKSLNKWLASLIVIPIIYIASHAAYFWYHPSILEFIRYQLWIIKWRMGNPYVVGNIWRTILTGSYKNWWDGRVVVDSEWTLFFAVIVIFGLLGGVFAMREKKKKLIVIFIICIVYFGYLTIYTVGVSRYVLLVYPFLTILSVNFFINVFDIIRKWKKGILKR